MSGGYKENMADKILRFEDAVFNVSGLFVHDAAILYFYDICEICGIQLNMLVHGNIPCKWNSGRIIQSVEEEYQDWCLREYDRRNIPVFLTFSNYLVKEEDLDDTLSNGILEKVAKVEGNGTIVASALLRDYIHDKYPNFKLYSSILRIVSEEKQGNADYYLCMLDQFDRVVLHPDDGFNYELLEQLKPADRFEILINENCIRNCPVRKQHCDIVSKYYENRRPLEGINELNQFKLHYCQNVQSEKSLEQFLKGKITTCNFSKNELEKCYDMGFRYFKVQGRSLSTAAMLYDLIDYMIVEPASRTVYKMIMDRIGSKSIYENREILQISNTKWEKI